jgi:2-dehydro-3-deoxyphosphogluconate aldolase/(4S)-4-hydroxy-2-oxoglutarate aldolase
MSTIIEQLSLLGIIPVVVIEKPESGENLAKALMDGGLPCMEITFRTDGAATALKMIAKSYPQILLGAGTVLTIEQAAMAIDSGAKFIVAPGLNRKVVEYCRSKNVPFIPGVATPTDIEMALDMGLEILKLFPAEGLGGVEYLKALSGPYKQIKFIPTGGIEQSNLLSYLTQQNVLACGGSWMVRSNLIQSENYTEIQNITHNAVNAMLGFALKHIGINCQDELTALSSSKELSDVIHFPTIDGSSSVFVGSSFEFTKIPFLGMHGHIAISTHSVKRAIYYLEQRGYKVLADKKFEKDGKIISIYLDKEIAGFALHLLQNTN